MIGAFLPVSDAEGGAFLLFLLLTFLFIPFLEGCVLGSYKQLIQTPTIRFTEFLGNGKQYFSKLLHYEFTLIFIGLSIVIFTFGLSLVIPEALVKLALDPTMELLDSKVGVILVGGILLVILLPISLAPFSIVIADASSGTAIISTYRLMLKNLRTIIPLILFFYILPRFVQAGLSGYGFESGIPAIQWAGLLIFNGFILLSIPTLTTFFHERLGQ